ncbi:MAG TPA: hypothetical protein VKV06_16395, partial [Acidimicrobiales bacterium]|nr:hypothetical protein [Acidimicrobiales bacterium]
QVRSQSDVDLVALTDVHAAILQAVRGGDPDEAVVALERDLHGCRDMLLDHLSERNTSRRTTRARAAAPTTRRTTTGAAAAGPARSSRRGR